MSISNRTHPTVVDGDNWLLVYAENIREFGKVEEAIAKRLEKELHRCRTGA
jgi:hypothetical protein